MGRRHKNGCEKHKKTLLEPEGRWMGDDVNKEKVLWVDYCVGNSSRPIPWAQ